MASKNVDSISISVFPATRRAYGSKLARQLTENSLVNLITHITDIDSYVITSSEGITEQLGDQALIEFIIHGYYFAIKLGNIISGINWDNIYAGIKIDSSNGYLELDGQDATKVKFYAHKTDFPEIGESGIYYYSQAGENNKYYYKYNTEYIALTDDEIANIGKYSGLTLYDAPPTDCTYYLQILTKDQDSGNYYISEKNRYKFKGNSIKLDTIDGGEIL